MGRGMVGSEIRGEGLEWPVWRTGNRKTHKGIIGRVEGAVDHRPGARCCTGLWSSVSGVGTGTRNANAEAKLGWGFPGKRGSGIEVLGKLGKR